MAQHITRKEFLKMGLGAAATAALGPSMLAAGCGRDPSSASQLGGSSSGRRPNVLLMMMDELRFPPTGYAPNQGENPDIREIIGFAPQLSPDNSMARFFEGFVRLRRNGVALRTHYVASAACVPSRTTLLTGQYPTVHHVSQTTGLFKSDTDPGFVFLDPNGIPTVGDWFQAAGYETHYFGKWHVSAACDDLGPWGFPFGKWDGPEPHGSNPSNMGVYRDPEFASDTVNFLNTKKGTSDPWFAVCSFVNPHDVSNWPVPWFLPQGLEFPGVQDGIPGGAIPPIPSQGAMSNASVGSKPGVSCPAPVSAPVPLNPDGFPQSSFQLPPTVTEDLSTKPTCQGEMTYKLGLAFKSKTSFTTEFLNPQPFALQGADSEAWMLAYGQMWNYLHYLSDLNLRRVLQALDDTGLAENTIVVFTADHGDYAGAHGFQSQKWHSAYEEAIHVPFVVSSPLVNPTSDLREINVPTSHIDLVPTLLGLAGFSTADQAELRTRITGQGTVPSLVGTDLSPYIRNPALTQTTPIPGHDSKPRPGVLFMTIDEITQMTSLDPNNENFQSFERFLANVELTRAGPVPSLTPGPITQPNTVYSLATGIWKFSRYRDPNGTQPDQFELYHLPSDPTETINLVNFRTGQVRSDVSVPGFTSAQLQAQKEQLAVQLSEQEALLLT